MSSEVSIDAPAPVLCHVSPTLADRFNVTMRDGRVFKGCGIQGSGGALMGRESFVKACRQRERNITMGLITEAHADGCTFVEVRCIDVLVIARVRT